MKTLTKPTLAKLALAGVTVALAAGCATSMISDEQASSRAAELMKAGFKERGQAKLDRLDQDLAQAECSKLRPGMSIDKDVAARIEQANLATIRYPAKMVGDWRQGERIAQSGVGKQFSDNPSQPSGGNCYACHQMTPQEISYGTIGPSLRNFGKLRGNSDAIQRYTFGKIYNAEAYSACSLMPRFGHNQILTQDQITHLVALLLDPDSPVNK